MSPNGVKGCYHCNSELSTSFGNNGRITYYYCSTCPTVETSNYNESVMASSYAIGYGTHNIMVEMIAWNDKDLQGRLIVSYDNKNSIFQTLIYDATIFSIQYVIDIHNYDSVSLKDKIKKLMAVS